MKKKICLVLMIIVVFSMMAPAYAMDKATLSSLSDAEIMAFLADNEIEPPALFSPEMSWIPFIRFVIDEVEANPVAEFTFGYVVAENFAYEIKAAVNAYYGTTVIKHYAVARSSTVLEDNTVYGSWDAQFEKYNCLGYAVEYYDVVNPGQIEWINNGNPKNQHVYNWYANVKQVSDWVIDDLESMGCTIVNHSMSIPTTDISAHTHLICVRVDNDGENIYGFRDFHLMKLSADGYWYHKPGKTNPLRYKYTPSNSREWVLESYDGTTYQRVEAVTYDSDIWFIEYTTPHEWEYVYCNNGQHIRTCTICGVTSGSASSCIYINNTCKSCGNYNGNIHITPNKRPGATGTVTE